MHAICAAAPRQIFRNYSHGLALSRRLLLLAVLKLPRYPCIEKKAYLFTQIVGASAADGLFLDEIVVERSGNCRRLSLTAWCLPSPVLFRKGATVMGLTQVVQTLRS